MDNKKKSENGEKERGKSIVDTKNLAMFARSSELMDFGGIKYYVPWDI